MNTFRIKAYAKINLGLDVLRRRPDGYHEVKMIMQTVDLYDDLEFTKLAEDEIRIFTDKEELPADQGNLIWRAAARMKELYQISEGVSVKLTKRIPIAAVSVPGTVLLSISAMRGIRAGRRWMKISGGRQACSGQLRTRSSAPIRPIRQTSAV